MTTQNPNFILKGTALWTEQKESFCVKENAHIVCTDGKCAGVFDAPPERYAKLPLYDCKNNLIIPGMTDLHIHAPQFAYRGLGMDRELLDWLSTYTFPEEAKFSDLSYAHCAYDIFVSELRKSPTCRAAVFATMHTDATGLLMEKLEESGLITLVGRVNMDRNGGENLQEESAAFSEAETRRWLSESKHLTRTKPVITPRFVPTCTDELLERLGRLQKETGLPVQSHLSENMGEIAWVKELCPWSGFYGDVYNAFGLFGGKACPTIMAHCVYSSPEEAALMKENGVYVAHCPQSNTNIASGIAPVRAYLNNGLNVGLGTDVAGGSSISLFRAVTDAIQVSKLRWRLTDESLSPLTVSEAFYLATKGGGAFFGKVGSFEEGYALDALILSDKTLPTPLSLDPASRLERLLYLGSERNIVRKFVAGREISLSQR